MDVKRVDNARQRCESGKEIALAINDAIRANNPADIDILLGLVERILQCNKESNHWVGDELHSVDTGEVFDGAGQLWSCNSKLCPSCLAKAAARSRKKLKKALENQKLFVGENLYFITLTVPNQNLSLLESRTLVYRAWTLFRKRKIVQELFVGGAKSEEFTFTRNGYHYHLHLLVRSKFINYNLLRYTWTECVRIAFMEASHEFFAKTRDGLLLCNVQRVNDKKKAIQEVCKYITKSDSWRKIPMSDLLDIARVRRFPRMFEMFGSFHIADEDKTILDTEDLSDGAKNEKSQDWRDECAERGFAAYKLRLIQEIITCQQCRKDQLHAKFPFATFTPLDHYP